MKLVALFIFLVTTVMVSDAGPQALKGIQRGVTQVARSNPVTSVTRLMPKPNTAPKPAGTPRSQLSADEWHAQAKLERLRQTEHERIRDLRPMRSREFIIDSIMTGKTADLTGREIRSIGMNKYLELADLRYAVKHPIRGNKKKIAAAIAIGIATRWYFEDDEEASVDEGEQTIPDALKEGIIVDPADVQSALVNVIEDEKKASVKDKIAKMVVENNFDPNSPQTEIAKILAAAKKVDAPDLKVSVNAVDLEEILRS